MKKPHLGDSGVGLLWVEVNSALVAEVAWIAPLTVHQEPSAAWLGDGIGLLVLRVVVQDLG